MMYKNEVRKFEVSRIFGGQNPSVSCSHLAGPMLNCPKIFIFGKDRSFTSGEETVARIKHFGELRYGNDQKCGRPVLGQ